MLDRKVRVKALVELGNRNYLLTLGAAEQALLAQPGQFVMLKCAPNLNDNPLLRRPYSILDLDRSHRTKRPRGLVLLVKDVGIGSHALAKLQPGHEVFVLGPQGRPFNVSLEAGSRIAVACLVAGGIGIAALYLLACRLLEVGVRPVLFYGGRTARDLVVANYFEGLGMDTFYATEDGTRGEAGMVTRPLENFLRARVRSGIHIYACGPWAMMKATNELAVRFQVPCEVSLEARMGCSLGACMGCVVRTLNDSGEEEYLRVCLEGPIMESRRIDWGTPPI